MTPTTWIANEVTRKYLANQISATKRSSSNLSPKEIIPIAEAKLSPSIRTFLERPHCSSPNAKQILTLDSSATTGIYRIDRSS